MPSDRTWHMFTRNICWDVRLESRCVDKKKWKIKNSVGGIHKQHLELSPLRHEHTHGHGHSRDGAGSGDVPVLGSVSYPRDSRSYCDEVGQEEGQGNRIVCVHPHS